MAMIPVEAAVSLYGFRSQSTVPRISSSTSQSTAATTAADSDNADYYFKLPQEMPSRLLNFFEGWPSLSRAFNSTYTSTESDTEAETKRKAETKTETPPTQSRRNSHTSVVSENGIPSRPTIPKRSYTAAEAPSSSDEPPLRPRQRLNSIKIGDEINRLLEQDKVKRAVAVLEEAVTVMNMTDEESSNNPEQVAAVYSKIIRTLCEPPIFKIVSEISGVDIRDHAMVQQSVLWRLFTKVIESGYVLEREAYRDVVTTLMDYGYNHLALQALYSIPRHEWDTDIYKLAITLHLIQTPKQIEEAEWIMSDYGKPFIEIGNPLAPSDLPPIRIDTPLMSKVSDEDKFNLWMYYQALLSETDWQQQKESYESARQDQERKARHDTPANLVDWARRRLSIQNVDEESGQAAKIDIDNTMIYISLRNSQYEYGWQVYENMKDAVNKFTPRVTMHLCWTAYHDTPLAIITRRAEWESRAWELYARFMFSKYLMPNQPEMSGFLCDLLSINATSPENHSQIRYTKAMSVYQWIKRGQYDHLLSDEQICTPILCTLLHDCRGSPSTIIKLCQKAFEIWHTKQAIDSKHGGDTKESFSVYWALLVLCLKSGDTNQFHEVLQALFDEHRTLPTSLLAPIQRIHDRYLRCHYRGDQPHETAADEPDIAGATCCYFDGYLYRPIKYTDDRHHDVVEMDELGFVNKGSTKNSTLLKDTSSTASQPIEYFHHMLARRTNIHDANAARLAMAVSMGAAKDEDLIQKPLYCTPTKVTALIRHCLKESTQL
ncbi:uncharacterized protein BYT42DRAFT_645387 [Radiomyces spectabilis]|uniref:uncharacterized protein n=1 Tax=Radiomyces spectabilis TaxID=64574 RepID=UPI00221F7B02|nr:uncharacterized protein BYT42DRAFT_645387 [Radiomyces spectabilis]KAI8377824.1 hypothetical protein BYT42DRAFT_645387 [Radiomyces spectabilis]